MTIRLHDFPRATRPRDAAEMLLRRKIDEAQAAGDTATSGALKTCLAEMVAGKTVITMRISLGMHEAAISAARRNGVSLNTLVVTAIQAELERLGAETDRENSKGCIRRNQLELKGNERCLTM
jgi:hypothetical protein